MPRFVLLYHDCPPHLGKPSHWDFMLEDEGALLTWVLAEQPTVDGIDGSTIVAVRLVDHRLAYLDYEGPVSGDRGLVSRVDAGTFTWIERTPARVRVQLAGTILSGKAILTLVGGDAWEFAHVRGGR
jgi:hypothetical protein